MSNTLEAPSPAPAPPLRRKECLFGVLTRIFCFVFSGGGGVLAYIGCNLLATASAWKITFCSSSSSCIVSPSFFILASCTSHLLRAPTWLTSPSQNLHVRSQWGVGVGRDTLLTCQLLRLPSSSHQRFSAYQGHESCVFQSPKEQEQRDG